MRSSFPVYRPPLGAGDSRPLLPGHTTTTRRRRRPPFEGAQLVYKDVMGTCSRTGPVIGMGRKGVGSTGTGKRGPCQ